MAFPDAQRICRRPKAHFVGQALGQATFLPLFDAKKIYFQLEKLEKYAVILLSDETK